MILSRLRCGVLSLKAVLHKHTSGKCPGQEPLWSVPRSQNDRGQQHARLCCAWPLRRRGRITGICRQRVLGLIDNA